MKKIFFLFLVGISFVCEAQKTLQKAIINGSVEKVNTNISSVCCTYLSGSNYVIERAIVHNKKYTFSIKGELPLPILMYIIVKDKTGKGQLVSKSIFITEGINTVSSIDSFSNLHVKGSAANDDYSKLISTVTALESKRTSKTSIDKAKLTTPEEGKAAATALAKETNDIYLSFIKENPSSPVALYALRSYAGNDIDPVKVEPLFNTLSAKIKNSEPGKKLAQDIAGRKSTEVGLMAPEFSLPDTSGKSVSLASFKGKYLLVDFWASWCLPCRAENPNVVKAFNAYKNKQFTILSVSLEKSGDKDVWLKAIRQDQLAWTHVSDFQGFNNAAARLYGILTIPQNFLLDPSGKIIAKNLRGEELEQKLKEIIK